MSADGRTFALMDRTREGAKQLEMQEEQAYALSGESRWGGERQLIFWSEDSPAKAPASPASGSASPTTAPRSSGRSSASRNTSKPRGRFSRTFQGCVLWGSDTTSRQSWPRLRNAGLLSAGELWTADISTWPSAASECSLSAVLQRQVSRRFCLSPRAAAGIVKRAAKKGRKLPDDLASVLISLAALDK